MRLELILKVAVKGGASDLNLKVGSLPRFRHNGDLVSLSDGAIITSEMMKEWFESMVPPKYLPRFIEKGEVDFAYQAPFGTRFRVNAFKQKGNIGMVMRIISSKIRTLAELQLPVVITQAASFQRGLTLVTGATGSGKSTTLAAIVQEINTTRSAHIVTIEDPIEFHYQDDMSTINQREVGEDTMSFAGALKASLRQDPDVILVGELRDAEATETALMAAETGHMVLSTLHTQDAVDSLTRVLSYFSPHQHKNIRLQLAGTLNMVVSQRLIPKADGKGMVAACEVLVANSYVKEIILGAENFSSVHDAIKKGNKTYGMQTFDFALLNLYQKGIITKEMAIEQATSRENMKLMMSGVSE